MGSGKHREERPTMKAYFHSRVLSQRLSVLYDEGVEYLEIQVKGFKEKLVLRAQPNSEFMVAANHNKLLKWEKSSFWLLSPETVLEKVKGKIKEIRFLGKKYRSWAEFLKDIEAVDLDKREAKYRSTIEMPESVGVALRLKAEGGDRNIRQIMIDALRAYL